MPRRCLLDRHGRIKESASAKDLEIICSDPSYTDLLDQVVDHPSCWPELAAWITRRLDDPAIAGAPPAPPATNDGHPSFVMPRIVIPHPFATLRVSAPSCRPACMIGMLLAVFIALMVLAPHLLGTVSAGASDSPTSSTRAATDATDDVFADARDSERRAKRSPVWDDQLERQTVLLDKAMTDGDVETARRLAAGLDDMRLQKTRVRIGDVTSSLSDSIDQAGTLKDAPDSDAKKTMTALSDTWSAKSVDETNLAQAETAAQQLKKNVDAVQKDQDRRQEEQRKAKEEQEQQTRENQQSAPAPVPQPVAPQQTPQQQITPRQQTTPQQPQAQRQPSAPQNGGTDGVAIG